MKSARWLAVGWLLTLTFALLVVTDAFPWLRGDAPWIPAAGRWVWPYEAPPIAAVLLPALGVALYTIGAWALLRARRAQWLILWAYGGAVLLPLLLMTVEGNPLFLLFTRSTSTITGGYHYASALVTDLGDALRDWPGFLDAYRTEVHLDMPGGVALSPPGLVALYEGSSALFAAVPPAAEQFSDLVRPLQCQNLTLMSWRDADLASGWPQMFMPLWAALGVAPLYRLGAALFDRRRARLAVALWPLVPGMAIFQPRFNVFYPLITLVMLATLWRGLLRERPRWIALSGFVLSVGMLLNLSLVPLGLLAGLIILGTHWLAGRSPAQGLGLDRAALRRSARDLAAFGVGVASVWVTYGALAGLSPLALLRDRFELHTHLYRPYAPWLIMHPYDMILFVGLPVAGLALWRIGGLMRLRRPGAIVTRGDVLAGASALTLAILVLSGTARGETGRVWLFFAPVWLLLAADRLAGRSAGTAEGVLRRAVHALAMQAIVLVSMTSVLRANFTALTEPIDVAAAETLPAFPVEARFERDGDVVTLVGLSVETASEAVTLHLYWRAETRVERPYVLTLLSVRPDGSPGESLSWDPRGWDYPPACWSPGEVFVDTVEVPLGAGALTGDWSFSLSIVDVFTREPVPVTLPDGTTSTQVGIGPVRVGG